MIEFIHIPKNAGSTIQTLYKKSKKLNYNGHSCDPTTLQHKSLIVIRNPIDRFCSAVRYAIQQYSDEYEDSIIGTLVKNGYDTPSTWIQLLQKKSDPNKDLLLIEMNNKSHYIGKTKLKQKWTYSPQSLWIKNPNYIILFENFEEEFKIFSNKNKIQYKIKKENSTKKDNDVLSNSDIKYLQKIYSEDFKLYNYYKSLSVDERLNSF